MVNRLIPLSAKEESGQSDKPRSRGKKDESKAALKAIGSPVGAFNFSPCFSVRMCACYGTAAKNHESSLVLNGKPQRRTFPSPLGRVDKITPEISKSAPEWQCRALRVSGSSRKALAETTSRLPKRGKGLGLGCS